MVMNNMLYISYRVVRSKEKYSALEAMALQEAYRGSSCIPPRSPTSATKISTLIIVAAESYNPKSTEYSTLV